MTAFATLLTPVDASPAIELGNVWRKRILPIGEIEYQGRQLKFTRSYLQGLLAAWQQGAYDQVPLQFADARNTHTNDPERTRGWITDMELGPDGLYITAELTERGQATLSENPYLGVSARIVEQYQRSDGEYFPAAIQHVLGTLDPRIPGLGAWQEVQLASESSVMIDLSNLSFAGEPHPAPAGLMGTLTDAELADLIDAISEADADDSGELSDAELTALMQAAEGDDMQHDAFSEFDETFTRHAMAEQDRQDAISAAIVEDTLHPATRQEDKIARAISRAGQGVYDGQQMSFTAESSAVELAMATGRGICGVPDEWGRCSARFHDLECAHGQGTDWAASGPPRSTYAASLSNFADSMAIDLAPRQVWDDPDDADLPPVYMPSQTIELAHQLAHDWGLDASAPGGFTDTSPGWQDVLRPPGAPVSVRDELLAGMGVEMPAADRPSYPGVAQLARDMGLK